ncbi:Uncharacterised protein [Mycobacterium tuberculosis]|uniref:Uncharacterized protein n=1 Tax=Mycobacterium tuberculosis TaxID=1773 RepID=A0A654U1R5_MYCTX|nr:Uncharacterised protein [Mycobacterium tuberculosis]CKT26672.1 Uncharacterised protein [Mycobacterium tuberculosis]
MANVIINFSPVRWYKRKTSRMSEYDTVGGASAVTDNAAISLTPP